MRNETKACFLDDPEAAYISSAEPSGAVEDAFEDRLQVVRRAGDSAQHFRNCRLLLDKFRYLLFQF
jgi:hypothetical protein